MIGRKQFAVAAAAVVEVAQQQQVELLELLLAPLVLLAQGMWIQSWVHLAKRSYFRKKKTK